MVIMVLNLADQYDTLNGYTEGNSRIDPVEDGMGRFIVGLAVRDSGDFPGVQDILNSLEEIEFVPAEAPE